MKRSAVIGVVLLAAAAAFAAKKEKSPRETAREAFEAPFAAVFAGKTALPAAIAGGASREAYEWTFALPVEDDARLRFIRATLEDGQYRSGTLHYFGAPEQPLTADEFKVLRAQYPMAAVRGKEDGAVRLLVPTKVKQSQPVPPQLRYGLRINPLASLYGSLLPALPRLGVKTANVAYRVDYTHTGGKTETLGVVKNAKKQSELDDKAILARIGELSGLISVRERIDYLLDGSLAYVPCNPGSEK